MRSSKQVGAVLIQAEKRNDSFGLQHCTNKATALSQGVPFLSDSHVEFNELHWHDRNVRGVDS